MAPIRSKERNASVRVRHYLKGVDDAVEVSASCCAATRPTRRCEQSSPADEAFTAQVRTLDELRIGKVEHDRIKLDAKPQPRPRGARRPRTKYSTGPTKLTAMTAAHLDLLPLTSSGFRTARSAQAVAASDTWIEASVKIAVCWRLLSSLHRFNAITPSPWPPSSGVCVLSNDVFDPRPMVADPRETPLESSAPPDHTIDARGWRPPERLIEGPPNP